MDVQNYAAKIQKVSAEYGWMEARMIKIQNDYDTTFRLEAPPSREDTRQGRGRR